MDELSLLKDYVTTMQRQLQSKNRELKTLRDQYEKLLLQSQSSSRNITPSNYSLQGYSSCSNCSNIQRQLTSLQVKYDNLQAQKSTSSSLRILSSSTVCGQCPRIRRELQQLKTNYQSLQRSSTANRGYSIVCGECNKFKSELATKQSTIFKLNSEISTLNSRIVSFQNQSSNYKTVSYVNNPRSNDTDRITYLNSQVQQYLALINSLRSEIKTLNIDSQKYISRIREFQLAPPRVQYIQRQLSQGVRDQINALKIQIGELSNDNILLRRQNSQLKRQVLNLPRSQVTMVDSCPYTHHDCGQPVRFHDFTLHEDRARRHFRKSPAQLNKSRSKINNSSFTHSGVSKMNMPHKINYEDLQRKIQLLQVQNGYLKGGLHW